MSLVLGRAISYLRGGDGGGVGVYKDVFDATARCRHTPPQLVVLGGHYVSNSTVIWTDGELSLPPLRWVMSTVKSCSVPKSLSRVALE